MLYVKLFGSLYQGSLRGKAHAILVFMNLLASSDDEGFVDKHFRAISDEVGLTVEEVKSAIIYLESPDPESRSPEQEGRRITRMDGHRDWGWHITNYVKYKNLRNKEERQKQNREAQQRYREKRAKSPSAIVSNSKQSSSSVSICNPKSAQEEEEEEKEQIQGDPPCKTPLCFSDQDPSVDELKNPETAQEAILMTKARVVLHYLNEAASKRFRELPDTLKVIAARLVEVGGDVDGVKTMIYAKCLDWKGDPVMDKCLKPTTLFRKSKFHEYYDDRNSQVKHGSKNNRGGDGAGGNLRNEYIAGIDEWNAQHQSEFKSAAQEVDNRPPQ